jgi:hypothetical protein
MLEERRTAASTHTVAVVSNFGDLPAQYMVSHPRTPSSWSSNSGRRNQREAGGDVFLLNVVRPFPTVCTALYLYNNLSENLKSYKVL